MVRTTTGAGLGRRVRARRRRRKLGPCVFLLAGSDEHWWTAETLTKAKDDKLPDLVSRFTVKPVQIESLDGPAGHSDADPQTVSVEDFRGDPDRLTPHIKNLAAPFDSKKTWVDSPKFIKVSQ